MTQKLFSILLIIFIVLIITGFASDKTVNQDTEGKFSVIKRDKK